MADDKLLIRLNIYDTELSVNILRDEEEYYRSAGKLINEIINTYFNRYKGKTSDKQILYMTMMDLALNLKKTEAKNENYKDALLKLTTEMEEALK